MVTSTFATPATATVAGVAARSLAESAGVSFVRVWLADGFGSAEPVATAGGRPEGGLKLHAAAAAAAIARGRRFLEPLDAAAGVASSVRIGLPLHVEGACFGLVEIYANDAFTFGAAAAVEAGLGDFAVRLAATAASTGSDGTARAKILVADDDPAVRALIRSILERSGFDICEAHDGWHALETIAKELPDLVLMDWTMPVLDGIETTLRMRGAELTKTIPVVMLTGNVDPAKRNEAFTAGVQDFVTKPFTPRDLVTRVSHFSRWRKLLARESAAPASETIPVRKRRFSPTESLAMYESRHGNLGESLELFVTEAESCEATQRFAHAARAYRGASGVAQQMRADDLGNKYMRLAGKMYLSLAETTPDPGEIERAYVNAAKCFLEAGNSELVAKSLALAASFEAMTETGDGAPQAP